MLINTSRVSWLTLKSCYQSTEVGKIGYLGLDVYEQETDLFFEWICQIRWFKIYRIFMLADFSQRPDYRTSLFTEEALQKYRRNHDSLSRIWTRAHCPNQIYLDRF
jgi:lactate dehydrogenase-like 2-hydroxyacid dehydrogenase